MSTIERMASEAFAPKKGLKFIDVFGLHALFEGLAWRSNLVLVGPKGVGKTLSFQTFAEKKNCAIITFDCSEDVRRAHLLGSHVLRGDSTPFVLGPLTTAFEVANETGQCILVLEEVNALSPQMQKVLNSPTDFRRRLEVPECKQVFELKNDAKLWITGTMNTAVYGGVYALNEDLKSRFRLLALDYPSPKQERAVLDGVLSSETLHRVTPATIENVLRLAVETRSKALEYALSPRDVQQVIDDISHIGLKSALRLVLSKFDDSDRETVQKRIQSIFGATE